MTPRLATTTLIATLALALATALEAEAASVQSFAEQTSGSISGPIYFGGALYATMFTTPAGAGPRALDDRRLRPRPDRLGLPTTFAEAGLKTPANNT